jgi:transcriptional regulator with XRE-family HTH domain
MVMRIKKIRISRGIPQQNVASLMGVCPSAISNWESEVALPRTRQLPLLAKILNCEIGDLFEDENTPPPGGTPENGEGVE